MARARSLPRADFELDDQSYQELLATVIDWQAQIRHVREHRLSNERNEPNSHRNFGLGL
ncbi:MAG: hypothetical protein M3276_00340 [Actinomycetota bacterium]|nr:hypothetical protein [Actinomycetota bacterium]